MTQLLPKVRAAVFKESVHLDSLPPRTHNSTKSTSQNMPHATPSQSQIDSATNGCNDARRTVVDKWSRLSSEKRTKIKDEMEFDVDAQLDNIENNIEPSNSGSDMSFDDITKLNTAKGKYVELNTELDSCIRDL